MIKTDRYITWIGTIVMGVCAWAFWAFVHPETLAYQEGLQMFVYDSEYCMERVAQPAGVARYVAEFLTQFYNYVVFGAMIVALIYVALQLCSWVMMRRLCKSRAWYWESFLPVVCLWFCMGNQNIKLTFAVALLFAVIAACLYPREGRTVVKALFVFLATPLLYWCAGPAVFVFALYVALASLVKKEYAIGVASVLLPLACVFASAAFVQQPMYRLFYGIGYSLMIIEFPSLVYVTMGCFALMPFVVAWLPELKNEKTERKVVVGNMVLTLAVGVVAIPLAFDSLYCEAVRYDMLVRGQKWDKIIEMAEKRSPDLPTTVASLNLALGMKGQLVNRGMSFYQNGWAGAFPQFNRNCERSILLSEICYQAALINSAQRFAFEANEAIPDNNKSARLVKRLVDTNIINGQYEVARKYLRLLQKTFFYRKWAEERMPLLGDDEAVRNSEFYGYLCKARLTDDFFFSDAELDKIMGQLVMHYRDNSFAIQYLLFLPQLVGDQQKYMKYREYVESRFNDNGL